MYVECRLARIIISELTENQVIYLREVDGERQFPILIGIFEATSIDRRIKMNGEMPPRPLTHDLINSVAKALGADVVRIVVSDLQEATYFAQIVLEGSDGEVEVDARPSDAIALAVTHDPPLPILVAEEVLASATDPMDS